MRESTQKNVLLIGNGKVGSALAGLIKKFHNLTVYDVEAVEVQPQKFDVMHVCFPYTKTFEREVSEYIRKFCPDLVIIESTVMPGTTRKIWYSHPETLVCHSPIRGCHQSLDWGLSTYTKFVGPCTLRAGLIAERYYKDMGLKTRLCKGSVETEVAKLLNLSYFAAQIAFFQEAERKVAEHSICYEDVINFFLTTTRDSKGEVQRPIFKGDPIGGTCVMQGLEKIFKDEQLYRWIEDSNDKVKEDAKHRTGERSSKIPS